MEKKQEENGLFRIIVASDNHLGYDENDKEKGDDSFNAFEEILHIAKKQNVDFVVLAGDLFDEHNPSKKTLIKAGNILKNKIYGKRKLDYTTSWYDNILQVPNFQDQNLSISIPIFSIHGNHDNPSGIENLSSIDIYANKEINYFGKINNSEEFKLWPIIFEKNGTKIALYGIGNMKDSRLSLALKNKKVTFIRPKTEGNDQFFNILVLHQNKEKGMLNSRDYLSESLIPRFFQLVIWGHEHECFTRPRETEYGFYVYQPGSSVATSLIEAESKKKHIGLLEIQGINFRIIPVELYSVRPFIYRQFELKDYSNKIKNNEDIQFLVENIVEECIAEADDYYKSLSNNNESQENNSYKKLLPLIRLKIEHTGYPIISNNFIAQKYNGKIANLKNVLNLWVRNEKGKKKKVSEQNVNDSSINDDESVEEDDNNPKQFIEDNIKNYMNTYKINNIVNNALFFECLDKEVNDEEKNALTNMFNKYENICLKHTRITDAMLNKLDVLNTTDKQLEEKFDEFFQEDEIKADMNRIYNIKEVDINSLPLYNNNDVNMDFINTDVDKVKKNTEPKEDLLIDLEMNNTSNEITNKNIGVTTRAHNKNKITNEAKLNTSESNNEVKDDTSEIYIESSSEEPIKKKGRGRPKKSEDNKRKSRKPKKK